MDCTEMKIKIPQPHCVVCGDKCIARFPNPDEAEAAVRKSHGPAERFEALDREIVPGIGPQPNPGEVRLLKGAV
jgi:hypothetical protein